MSFILCGILTVIGFGTYLEGKDAARRGLKLILSLLLAVMIAVVMDSSVSTLVEQERIQGKPLFIAFHTIIPAAVFFIFQLLLYNIKMYGK
ncbi:hypothetical protein [Bacillus sp. ISL-55]|uniref:hypothetical protein n=1 Tax=Bacillus sp. ISL-55 TaxID=2819134 RepID=UPI001BE8AC91|nr:hypothetical protein [Bacillus sp. ISL-55]MBT2693918.1 hypothetical protein [Bacillus sp. ISL-55]